MNATLVLSAQNRPGNKLHQQLKECPQSRPPIRGGNNLRVQTRITMPSVVVHCVGYRNTTMPNHRTGGTKRRLLVLQWIDEDTLGAQGARVWHTLETKNPPATGAYMNVGGKKGESELEREYMASLSAVSSDVKLESALRETRAEQSVMQSGPNLAGEADV
jgi:hypothetical protein